jgi:hypothetical protein
VTPQDWLPKQGHIVDFQGQVKNEIMGDKMCKCSLWGKILHPNKWSHVVQITLLRKEYVLGN